jgi:hypothetical protein
VQKMGAGGGGGGDGGSGGVAIAASNTTYTSGTVVFSGNGNVTVSTNGQTVLLSAGGGAGAGIGAIANSETTYTSGTVALSGLGNVTVRSTTGNAFQISVPAQSVQPETQTFVGGLGNSQTTYTSGTVNLSVVAGNLTIRSTTGQAFQFSMSQTVQAETQTFVGGIGNSETTYTSGTVNLSGLANITVRSTTGQAFQFSVPNGATATGNLGGIAVNALTTYTSGTVVLSAGNNITLGTNGQTVTISGNSTQSVQTQQTLSMFAVSNTTQSTSGTAANNALSFGGAGIASVGVTGGSVVISVPAGGGGGDGGVFAGVSTAGNTAGSTGTVSTGNFVLVGSQGITLSQSTAGAGSAATVTILGDALTNSGWNPYADQVKVTGQAGQGTLNFDPMRLEGPMQYDRLVMVIHNTNSSNSSGSHTLSFWVGIYTRNAATLSLLQSTSSSTALTHSGTAGSYSLYSGQRLFTIPMTTTLTAGDYWLGVVSRTTSAGTNGSYSQWLVSNVNSDFLGHFGSSHNTTYQLTLGQGVYSATTSGIPSAVSFSQIRGSDSQARRAPFVMFASSTV